MSLSEDESPNRTSEFSKNLEMLREIEFFSGLPLEPLKVIAYLASREHFSEGDHLFHRDDDDGQALYIISGRAKLERHDEKGKNKTLSTFGPGSFIGGLALLSDMRRLFSLRVEEDMECLVITREKFVRVLEQFPEITPKVLDAVVKAVRSWEKAFLLQQEHCETCLANMGVSLV